MTIPFADYSLGDALLTVLEIFFLVIWVWILITIMVDLFRDHEVSGWWKAVWVFFLIFVPFLTALVYLIVRGHGMRERAIQHQADMQKASESYIKEVAGTSPVDELHKLNDLREKGAISQQEFDSLKAKIVTT
jgi:NADH:ubiquinone oxidoreductase subunit 6 (subunit J)